jgi:hypothetical protein
MIAVVLFYDEGGREENLSTDFVYIKLVRHNLKVSHNCSIFAILFLTSI